MSCKIRRKDVVILESVTISPHTWGIVKISADLITTLYIFFFFIEYEEIYVAYIIRKVSDNLKILSIFASIF